AVSGLALPVIGSGQVRLGFVRDRNGRARGGSNTDPGLELADERLDDPGSQSGLCRVDATGHANTIIGHGQYPTRSSCRIADVDLAMAMLGEGMLERVDHELCDDQPDAYGGIGTYGAVVHFDADRNLVVIVDHRRPEAIAELGQ